MILGLGLIAPFFLYILIGVLAEKLLRIDEEGQRLLDAFIFYIALPALLFQSVRTTPDNVAHLPGFLALTTAATGLMFVLGMLLGRQKPDGDHPAVYGLAASYSNIGYMGPTLTVAVLGPAAGAPAAFIFCADVLLIFTIWPAMISDQGFRLSGLLRSLRKVATHPFILAVIAALAFSATGWTLPAFLDTPLTGFQNAAAPTALFSLGLTLARTNANRLEPQLAGCLGLKLIAHPAAVALLFMAVGGFDPLWVSAAIIMGALPPAANVYVMARAEAISVPLAARTVLFGTALSALTLPIVIALLS